MNRLRSWSAFLAPKLHRIFEFFVSQGITMAGNLFYGFLCVRLLSIADYAKFAVVFGFLVTLSTFMDIGISGALLPLVGERIDDKQLIADYVASIRQLAHWLYLAVAPVLVIVFPILVKHQHWGWRAIATMIGILLVAGWSARLGVTYGAVLIIRRDRTVWYRIQMISSLGGLLLLGIAWSAHWLNAFSAMSISVAGIVFIALAYYVRAGQLLGVTGHPSKEKRNAVLHLTMPTMPNALFYSFQGQFSVFLITWFGQVKAVAGLGALNRLSRVYSLVGQMNPILLEPYFAKLADSRLKRNYVGVLAGEIGFCLLIISLAGAWPGIFLWVLGPKYKGLRLEVLLMIVASSLGYLAEMMWTIHCSRRFTYWWNGIVFIVYTVLTEILFIWKCDLSTVRGVLYMSIALTAGNVGIQLLVGAYGFIRGPRRILLSDAATSELRAGVAAGEL